LTIPVEAADFATDGAKAVLRVNVDDYAEIWVNGEMPRAAGRPSRGCIQGFNEKHNGAIPLAAAGSINVCARARWPVPAAHPMLPTGALGVVRLNPPPAASRGVNRGAPLLPERSIRIAARGMLFFVTGSVANCADHVPCGGRGADRLVALSEICGLWR
jgi:hypothetical protein